MMAAPQTRESPSARRSGVRKRARAGRTVALVLVTASLGVLLGPAALADTNALLADASRLFDAGNYQQAANVLNAARGKKAQDAPLHYWLARCYFELRQFDLAAASAEKSVELEPNNSEYRLWLGRAYGRKAEQAGGFSALSSARKSRREFEEAVRLDPANLHAQRDLIEFYFRAPGIVGGGEDKARRQIQQLETVDAVEAHLARADFLMHKGKPEQAEAECRQVLEAKPTRIGPYIEVADFYRRRNDAVRMEEAVEAAARVDASDRRLGYYRGVVRVLAGNRLDEAEQLLKNYLSSVPRHSDLPSHAAAREWLGRLYEQQGRRQAAADQYRVALEIDPRSKGAREALRRVSK